jgi:hypothetical protein
MTRCYVSITGLQVQSYFRFPQFFYHALPSMQQANLAPGNISTSVHSIGSIQHTMTVWEDRKYMLQYLHTGPHLQAMKASGQVGRYVKVYGYWTESTTLPNWNEARQLWEEKGRITQGKPCRKFGDAVAITERASEQEMNVFYYLAIVSGFLLAFLLLDIALLINQWKATYCLPSETVHPLTIRTVWKAIYSLPSQTVRSLATRAVCYVSHVET